jgi:SAM-dependent methyltransferase
MKPTGERIIPEEHAKSKLQYLLYLRHLFAYEFAKKIIPENSKVLEIGCGEGYGAAYLANNRPTLNIVAIDVDKGSISHAEDKYSQENCIYRHYDGHKIPYQESTFDAAICFQVIEHIDDDQKFVSEIYRILKPNGILIMTTPNKIYRLKPGQKPWNLYHIREYYPVELFQLCKSSFVHVEVMGVVGDEEIQRLEMKRCKAGLNGPKRFFARAVTRIFVIFMPAFVKRFLKKLLRRESTTFREDTHFASEYSVANYSIVRDHLETSLDVLCICRK